MAKSNHLPFEDWLLSEETLTSQETRTMQEHLQACDSCSQMSDSWKEVEDQLQRAPMISPTPGFTSRWRAHMAVDRQKQERRQTLYILLFASGSAGLLFVFLGILMLPAFESPRSFLLAWGYQFVALFSLANASAEVLLSSLRILLGVVPATLWAGITAALGTLSLVWMVSIQKLTSIRRITL